MKWVRLGGACDYMGLNLRHKSAPLTNCCLPKLQLCLNKYYIGNILHSKTENHVGERSQEQERHSLRTAGFIYSVLSKEKVHVLY